MVEKIGKKRLQSFLLKLFNFRSVAFYNIFVNIGRMTEQEKPLNPETIYGKEFRIPAIIGLGSEWGYSLEGLHLPTGWEKGMPRLKESSPEGLRRLFELDCKEANLNLGNLKFDNNTNVLTEITIPIDNIRQAKLYLETWRYPRDEDGVYTSENVNSLRVAIILQATACRFLRRIDPELELMYAYIEHAGGGGYHSVDLRVPEKILQMKEPITNDFAQRRFEIEASNIAGRFGSGPVSVEFDRKGLLTEVSLRESGARYYHFSPDFKNYYPHNVDSAWQAATLHGVCAAFINSQLQRKDIV